ncbi:hypothetical protein C2W62_29020 [Candidatus Entotheonella serta]|nr:hypothetical protein C2W62_29020 [Candidatus Entotheonella serta]
MVLLLKLVLKIAVLPLSSRVSDTYRATAHCDIANNGWVSDAVPSDNRHTVCAEIARRTNGRDTAQLTGIDAKGADVSRWLSIAVVKPELPRLYGSRIACCG